MTIQEYENLYVFVLGRETKIALLELESVLRRFGFGFSIITVTGNLAYINIESEKSFDHEKIISSLGGTIKIFKILSTTNTDEVVRTIAKHILEEKLGQGGKIKFSLSNYSKDISRKDIQDMGIKLKMGLKSELSIRYIENREGGDLQPIVSAKNKLDSKGIEFGFFELEGSLLLGKLIAVYDPVSWSKRDYGKPKSDKFSGMMPPKLARMLVNITLDEMEYQNSLVFDPFCGSGNILIEAFSMGCDVVGSDISEKAVNDSTANLDWLIESTESDLDKPQAHQIFMADATKEDFSQTLKGISQKNMVLIAEPYLGTPKKTKSGIGDLKTEAIELKKTYLAFLKNISLIPNSSFLIQSMALVFPLFELENGDKYSLFSEAVDEIKELGYTPIRTLRYGRDYQVVKREVVFLSLKK